MTLVVFSTYTQTAQHDAKSHINSNNKIGFHTLFHPPLLNKEGDVLKYIPMYITWVTFSLIFSERHVYEWTNAYSSCGILYRKIIKGIDGNENEGGG